MLPVPPEDRLFVSFQVPNSRIIIPFNSQRSSLSFVDLRSQRIAKASLCSAPSFCESALFERPSFPRHERFEASEVGCAGSRGLQCSTDDESIGNSLNSSKTRSSACLMPSNGLMLTTRGTLTKLQLLRPRNRAKTSPTMLCARL